MSDVAARLQELSPAGRRALLTKLVTLKKNAPGKLVPLSYAQRRLWFLEQLVSGNPFYNESSALRLLFPLDTPALERALNEIVARHEALRTNFETVDGEPVQRVLPSLKLEMPVIDLSSLPEAVREEQAIRLAKEQARTPFNLAQAPLMRVALIRLAPFDHIFVLTMHHIVCDGWSMRVFFGELRLLYEAFARGAPSPLAPLPVQYTDYTRWQREWLQGAALEEQLAFWTKLLENLQPLDLPADRPRPAVPTFTGGREPVNIPEEVSRRLRALCTRESVTPFMALLGAFQAMLHRYTGQDDLAIGCPIANRGRAELEQLIGFFVNTLVMRTDLSGDPTFHELLRRVRETALSAYAHQDIPFEKLVEHVQPVRDPSRNPLFQVTFQIVGSPAADGDFPVEALRVVDVELATSKFDLRCDLWPNGKAFEGHLEYSADLFQRETVRSMARHFETMVAAMVRSPGARICDVRLLALPEQQKTIARWNDTSAAFPSRGCVHRRFEEIAARRPDLLAVREGASSVTYGELNHRANRLARVLVERGIQPGCLVVVLLDRSIDLVTAVLAVLKAGAAYVPLDPSYPKPRLEAMIKDALAPLVITSSAIRDQAPGFLPLIQIDAGYGSGSGEGNLAAEPDEACLAYVIFTSGSAGKPHGVEVLHGGLTNLVNWHQHEYNITSDDRATLYASPAFDASVWEMWPYLTAGASLHIPDRETHASHEALGRWMAANRITISFLPTPVAETFIANELPGDLSLRVLLTGGDKLRAYPRQQLPFRFVNHYGPTENTVVATFCDATQACAPGAPPIGNPISNVRAYVLDPHGRPLPPGIRGELYLGGAGLARGYLNDAELTRQRFVPDPFDGATGRLYRTGDLVRQRADGTLEFHGRVDGQIKLRGYRIEPGEIEAALDEHPDVERSLVISAGAASGEKAMVAYVVPKRIATDNSDAARLGREHIREWEVMYNELYERGGCSVAPEFDIVGWNSSYTGEPLSAEEMREQVEGSIARIRALGGRRILEIGCGTGLLLLPLAGDCERYVGTDFSGAVLAQVEQTVGARGWRHVELLRRRADDFTGIEPGGFDVVVLNSVVQYFPGMDYLVRVLEGAARAVKPGGFVFVGDVRNLALMGLLHAGIELARAGDHATVGELRERVERRSRQEPELLVAPEFFRVLPGHLDRVTAACIQVKRGRHHNELTRFRYDVVLQVGQPPRSLEAVEECRWADLGSVAALREYLGRRRPAALRITGVPDARLAAEHAMFKRLEEADAAEPASSLRDRRGEPLGVEPEDVWALEKELPYEVQVSWAARGGNAAYHLLCAPARGEAGAPLWVGGDEAPSDPKPWSAYANALLGQHARQRLAHSLREHLRRKLPEYMIPSSFVWMDALPLTPSGKLNRRALPAPDQTALSDEDVYAPPETDLHRRILAVWQQVLGIEKIGIDSNFFNIGGHSLLATQVIARLFDSLQLEIPLRLMFEKPTVRAFADAVADLQAAARAPKAPAVTASREIDLSGIDPDKLSDEEVKTLLLGLLAKKAAP